MIANPAYRWVTVELLVAVVRSRNAFTAHSGRWGIVAGQDLVEFVLARIAEDEAVATQAIDRHPIGYDWAVRDPADAEYVARWNPWRILNVCTIRRRLISAHKVMTTPTGELECSACEGRRGEAVWPCDTIRLLVLDWVEHPEFRGEWLHQPSRAAQMFLLEARAAATRRPAV